MNNALEIIPVAELGTRWSRTRQLLEKKAREAQGILVFGRPNIYWLSGHWANGVFWLPLEGEPVLFVRKGLPRAEQESPINFIRKFRSFKEIGQQLTEIGQSLPMVIGVDMNGLSWSLGQNLKKRMPEQEFVSIDRVLKEARSIKTDWELNKIRLAGQRHRICMEEKLPEEISPGMSEHEIGLLAWEIFWNQGHQGIARMSDPGEEILFGNFSSGDSANYSTGYSGPVGLRGMHPAVPFMGYSGKLWKKEEILTVDTLFNLEGYHTDKTQVYFAGDKKDLDSNISTAQEFCAELLDWLKENLLPGKTPTELYDHCLQQADKYGWSHGFMGIGDNKVPFVGHGIGLNVDEWPPVAKKINEPLQENMVIALEPKIGLKGIGMVGLENTLLITDQGGQSLTGNLDQIICLT